MKRSPGELQRLYGVVPCCGCGELLVKVHVKDLLPEEQQDLELLGIKPMSASYRDRHICLREAQTSGICLE